MIQTEIYADIVIVSPQVCPDHASEQAVQKRVRRPKMVSVSDAETKRMVNPFENRTFTRIPFGKAVLSRNWGGVRENVKLNEVGGPGVRTRIRWSLSNRGIQRCARRRLRSATGSHL
ncbi:hypothetical protein CA13_32900 [Planctomycetes bacterium CA13]|uniref:Uncharacterized protein n=1 Tax=Novipirellula herctigrandis TaxID=2527986 RepID=A0A5C5Z4B2_9BACT|nr:hypothetical protein CA13_32900 [Planctomycetes bacterium CA13]